MAMIRIPLNELPDYFAHRRSVAGMSQRGVAKELGVTGTLLSRFEGRDTRSSYEMLFKIATWLDIDIVISAGETATPRPTPPGIAPQSRMSLRRNDDGERNEK